MERDGTRDRVMPEPLLPSRRSALAMLREAVAAGRGPVLLTGEPGSGKTWLVGRLQAEALADNPRWLAVDLATTTAPADLLRAVAIGIGLVVEGQPTADALRLAIADELAERSADDRRWSLIVDEAHLATLDVLEELRILANRLGRADGFAALILVGQTVLAQRLRTRPLAALEARLSARAHLGPIDADEAGILLGADLDESEVERRHRDAAGNPGRLLRFDPPSRPAGPRHPWPFRSPLEDAAPTEQPAGTCDEPFRFPREGEAPAEPRRACAGWVSSAESSPFQAQPKFEKETALPLRPIQAEPGPSATRVQGGRAPSAPLVPSKPPLRVEEGLIEVGWDADAEPTPEDREPTRAPVREHEDPPPPPSEERIDDPYAALQAWNEWSTGAGRVESSGGIGKDGENVPSPLREHPNLRPERPEDFAPYSQLFSRKRPSRSEE